MSSKKKAVILPKLPSLAERVKWIRETKGWSQAELARRVNVDPSTINQLEDGKIERPRCIEGLSVALDVPPAWLQFGIEDIDKLSARAIKHAILFENMSDADKKALERLAIHFK